MRLFIFSIIILLAHYANAASCRQMKTYLRFDSQMCEQVTQEAEKLKDQVDARLMAAEKVLDKYKHEVYEGQKEYLKLIIFNKISKNDAKNTLIKNCSKLTREYVLGHLDQKSKKSELKDQTVSYFDIALLDKMKSTGVTNKDCMAAIFKFVDMHNLKIREKSATLDEDIEQKKCLHRQNCGPDGKPVRREM